MPLNLQGKVLRAIETKTVQRIGSTHTIPVDFRLITATNEDLAQLVEAKQFRADLYYRLNVIPIRLPPLRERREDIPLLAKQFIMEFNKKLGKNVSNLHLDTLNLFQEYQWPGNVREFQHVIEHAMNIIPADCSVLTPEYIFMPAVQHPPAASGTPLPGTSQMPKKRAPAEEVSLNGHMQNVEREAICKVLRACGGNVTKDLTCLQIEEPDAEKMKLKYAKAYTDINNIDPTLNYPIDKDRVVESKKFIEIVEARVEEIVENAWFQIPVEFSDKLLGGWRC